MNTEEEIKKIWKWILVNHPEIKKLKDKTEKLEKDVKALKDKVKP